MTTIELQFLKTEQKALDIGISMDAMDAQTKQDSKSWLISDSAPWYNHLMPSLQVENYSFLPGTGSAVSPELFLKPLQAL